MWLKSSSILISFVVIAISGGFCLAACPSADLTGDCFVDFEDFALMAAQWLTTDPCIPEGMAYIPGGWFQMGDSFNEGESTERPVHTVIVDSFYMGKYEITNWQYCDYLNSAMSQGLLTVTSGVVYKAGSGTSYPYCDTSTSNSSSQIEYYPRSYIFRVRIKGGRSMSNDPMVLVSWYGAAAYCNWRSQQEGKERCYDLSTWNCDFSKNGYRLPTEAEWEYAARGGLSGRRFPWGDTITHSRANYYSSSSYSYDTSPTRGYHPTWNDGVYPYTAPAGSFAANGYGLYDMAGNAWEWCNDWYQSDYYTGRPNPDVNPTGPTGPLSYRVRRGGGLGYYADYCRAASRTNPRPDYRVYDLGFRIVLDLSDDLALIPGGSFQMGDSFNEGDSAERPVHTVTVDSFYMGKYEITNRQYCDYLKSALSQGLITVTSGVVYQAGPGTTYPYCDTSTSSSYSQIAYSGGVFSVRAKSGRDMSNDPMVLVSWYGAAAYCNWRSQEGGYETCYDPCDPNWPCDFSRNGYHLATEAEWEYAARGGPSGRRFPWGDTISHDQANYYSYWYGGHPYYSYDVSPTEGFDPTWNDGIEPYISPVGSFAANGYGLYDMVGNVWDWCNDWYSSSYYSSSPTNNPTGPTGPLSYRVLRGGSWYSHAHHCRASCRGYYSPDTRYDNVGLRLVLDFQ